MGKENLGRVKLVTATSYPVAAEIAEKLGLEKIAWARERLGRVPMGWMWTTIVVVWDKENEKERDIIRSELMRNLTPTGMLIEVVRTRRYEMPRGIVF